jgi:hypothetical protein
LQAVPCKHTYTHTNTHTHTHTHILWIHKSIIKTVGCGTSHKYTNTQIYSVKYHIHAILQIDLRVLMLLILTINLTA